jgi:multimeric flavodoxin WrbA
MNITILAASPRKHGNTNSLLAPFMQELLASGCRMDLFDLYDLDIKPCTACRRCQKDWGIFGCRFHDDMPRIYDSVMQNPLLVLASPIYSFYCTPPLKAALDRLVYGMNKYYGEKKGPALAAGKGIALITTCGYRPEQGADLWEEGIKRYCKHSHMQYRGMLAERHLGYRTTFMDEDKEKRARAFAVRLQNIS